MNASKSKWLPVLCSLVLAVALVCPAANPVMAQEKAAVAKKAASTMASDKAGKSKSGADANVKSTSAQNDSKKAAEPAIQKGGKTRGYGPYTCVVHVDNRTGWIINVWIDGHLRGVVGGGGDLYVATGNGATTFYARADFDNGTYVPWGPRSFTCSGSYTWTLWP